jgi:hypothetical protein
MNEAGARTSADAMGRAAGSSRDGAWFDLCWRAVSGQARGLYPAVEAILFERVPDPEALPSPGERYRYHAIRAVLHEEAGRRADARRCAREALVTKALERRGFRFHPRVGSVHDDDAALDARLVKLAE